MIGQSYYIYIFYLTFLFKAFYLKCQIKKLMKYHKCFLLQLYICVCIVIQFFLILKYIYAFHTYSNIFCVCICITYMYRLKNKYCTGNIYTCYQVICNLLINLWSGIRLTVHLFCISI